LVLMAMVVAVILGLLIGILAGYFRDRLPDRVMRVVISGIQSVPDFFLGLLLIYLLFFKMGWAPPPVGRIGLLESPPPTVTDALILDSIIAGDWELVRSALYHSLMPVLALGVYYTAYFAKTARATLGPAFRSPQVEYARACGLSEWKVLGYAFRQARTPIITYGAILLAALIGGAAIVEIVFSWGGLGQWAVDRILTLDIPAIQGFILVTGTLTLLIYFALDILVAMLDPRVSLEVTPRRPRAIIRET
jgi:peptide/nickel transport system permease protein